MRPRMFVCSSTEGIPIAGAIQHDLKQDAEVTVWPQGTFTPSQYPLESLAHALDSTDFGIFVFSPDDILTMRNETMRAVRDNVIFELGLFIGHLGRERNFIVMPSGADDIHLPSDLKGLTPVTFDSQRQDGNLMAAIGAASYPMKQVIKKLGPFLKHRASEGQATAGKQVSLKPDSKEVYILIGLASASPGYLNVVPYDGGMGLMIDSSNIPDNDEDKSQAQWRAAIKSLLAWDLIEPTGGSSDQYRLTAAGYEAAAQCERQLGGIGAAAESYADLDSLMPELLEEIRKDLTEHPLLRKCVLKKKGWIFNGSGYLMYHYEEHPQLDEMFGLLENKGLVANISSGYTTKYQFTEEFVRYLRGNKPRPSSDPETAP
jgi:hypothetical protein